MEQRRRVAYLWLTLWTDDGVLQAKPAFARLGQGPRERKAQTRRVPASTTGIPMFEALQGEAKCGSQPPLWEEHFKWYGLGAQINARQGPK
jgi:hypothetical protein